MISSIVIVGIPRVVAHLVTATVTMTMNIVAIAIRGPLRGVIAVTLVVRGAMVCGLMAVISRVHRGMVAPPVAAPRVAVALLARARPLVVRGAMVCGLMAVVSRVHRGVVPSPVAVALLARARPLVVAVVVPPPVVVYLVLHSHPLRLH